jgi:hypothetical protein
VDTSTRGAGVGPSPASGAANTGKHNNTHKTAVAMGFMVDGCGEGFWLQGICIFQSRVH